jgi:hypothetical protein
MPSRGSLNLVIFATSALLRWSNRPAERASIEPERRARLDVGPPAVEIGGDQRGGPPAEFLQSAGFAVLQDAEPSEGEVSAAAGQVGAGGAAGIDDRGCVAIGLG